MDFHPKDHGYIYNYVTQSLNLNILFLKRLSFVNMGETWSWKSGLSTHLDSFVSISVVMVYKEVNKTVIVQILLDLIFHLLPFSGRLGDPTSCITTPIRAFTAGVCCVQWTNRIPTTFHDSWWGIVNTCIKHLGKTAHLSDTSRSPVWPSFTLINAFNMTLCHRYKQEHIWGVGSPRATHFHPISGHQHHGERATSFFGLCCGFKFSTGTQTVHHLNCSGWENSQEDRGKETKNANASRNSFRPPIIWVTAKPAKKSAGKNK